jgi:hypothetical protein
MDHVKDASELRSRGENIMAKLEKKVWNSGLEYVLCAAFESGVDTIELRLSASGVTGEGNAHRLMANLAKCGATVTQSGDIITVAVSPDQGSECLRRDVRSTEE